MRVVILWDEQNVEHIARHQVTRSEVEEVTASTGARWFVDDSVREGRLTVMGATAAGRLLMVILDSPTRTGLAYCVTARPMTRRERRNYERASE